MVFLAMAMIYHGIILFILRKIKKIKDAEMAQNDSEDVLSNSIIKLDRLILVIYGNIKKVESELPNRQHRISTTTNM